MKIMRILLGILDFILSIVVKLVRMFVRFLALRFLILRAKYTAGDVFKSKISGIQYTVKRVSLRYFPFVSYDVEYYKPLRHNVIMKMFQPLPRQIVATELFLVGKEFIVYPNNGFFNRLFYGFQSAKVRGKSVTVTLSNDGKPAIIRDN